MSDSEVITKVIETMKSSEALYTDGPAKKNFVLMILKDHFGDAYEKYKDIVDNTIELIIFISKNKEVLKGIQTVTKSCFSLCK